MQERQGDWAISAQIVVGFVLLHGVDKDQRTISDTDRKTALKRKKEYKGRR